MRARKCVSKLTRWWRACSTKFIRTTDEKRHLKAYRTLVRLFDEIHSDNMTILKHLIYAKDDIQPLVDGTTKSRVSLEVLRKKTVLLLISDLDIAIEDIELLNHLYRESRAGPENQFEIVWLPIVDIDPKSAAWDMIHQQKFEELQSSMSWYTVHHPSILEPAVIKYIREVWHFSKRIIIVALDPQGKLASPNALHMIWIWGSFAFPFTKEREEALWKEESWRLELIINGLDDGTITEWMEQGSYICLFGGEDLDWIRNFTNVAKGVAKIANIPLRMVYVGKSNSKEQMQRIATVIISEKLSYCWNDPLFFWFFWTRLESMLHSKLHHGKSTENDPVMHEIMTILSYDRSDQGWAIFCNGAGLAMARAKGNNVLESMEQFDKWKDDANQKGFVNALHDHLKQKELETPHHCSGLILPAIDGGLPKRVVCGECGRVME
ncbi:protein SIEVE ELEMENT OCCLUSION B-like [Syzygium oleosum]|uniref:protein SIEVE ELEMENT OCCLUSION B-like n=1 Tax=Syzygium oleosum TaxID=219896 RepID=UPI0024B9D678|nr:protein SIEVE ELEMENT OCCLUSION B-like [Syzygium oleosum]